MQRTKWVPDVWNHLEISGGESTGCSSINFESVARGRSWGARDNPHLSPPLPPPPLQAFFSSKQPTVFGWPKLFSTLCLTQSDPLLKNPGDTREFITSDYLCVLTVFLNSTSRVVSLPQPGRLHFTINRSQSCIEEVVKDEDDSEIQVYINTNFVFWKLVDTSFLVINGTLWNFALTSVNKCNPRPNYLQNPGSTKTATKISVIFLYVSPTLLSR